MLWTELDPMVVSRWLHDDEFRARIVKFVDSIVVCEVSREAAATDDLRRRLRRPRMPFGLNDPVEFSVQHLDDVIGSRDDDRLREWNASMLRNADEINAQTCMHAHTWTCRPKRYGNTKTLGICPRCRLDMGRVPSAETRFVTAEWSEHRDPKLGGKLTKVRSVGDGWTARHREKCSSCRRILHGGLFSEAEYANSAWDRTCKRCRRDETSCVACRCASTDTNLNSCSIAMLHALCTTCNPENMESNRAELEAVVAEYKRASLDVAALMSAHDHAQPSTCACASNTSKTNEECQEHAKRLKALELLKCRNIFGYHGPVIDRVVEADPAVLWVPLAYVARDSLYDVLATSQVVVDKCEEFLSTYNLSGVLTFINCSLAGSEGVNVGAVPDRMEDSSGEHGVAIKALANHIPRSQPSIAAALLVHFGNAVLYCSLDKANLAADMAELHKGRSEEDNLNSSDLLVITTDAADHEGDRRYVCYRNGN